MAEVEADTAEEEAEEDEEEEEERVEFKEEEVIESLQTHSSRYEILVSVDHTEGGKGKRLLTLS